MNDPAFVEGKSKNGTATTGDQPPFDLIADCIPAHLDPGGKCTNPTFQRIEAAGISENAAYLRNRFQDYLITRSDQMCERHKAGILAGQATSSLALNAVTTGVSATAAIVVAPATNILAAIGAFTSATNSHINAEIYQKFVTPAIVKKINEGRAEKLKEILAKRSRAQKDSSQPRQAAPVTEYTPESAVGDVERYNQFCSFAWGITALTDSNAKFDDTAPGIQQRIESLRKQQLANSDQIKALKGSGEEVRRLQDVNSDISRQIMVLQQQLFSAPLTIDGKSSDKK